MTHKKDIQNFLSGRSACCAGLAAFCACACVFACPPAARTKAVARFASASSSTSLASASRKSGTYVGFDVDVAKYVAKKLGYSEDEIVWKEAPSKQREAMLQNGDVDFIVATYSITDERKKVVSFAGPYFVAGTGSARTQGRNLHQRT